MNRAVKIFYLQMKRVKRSMEASNIMADLIKLNGIPGVYKQG